MTQIQGIAAWHLRQIPGCNCKPRGLYTDQWPGSHHHSALEGEDTEGRPAERKHRRPGSSLHPLTLELHTWTASYNRHLTSHSVITGTQVCVQLHIIVQIHRHCLSMSVLVNSGECVTTNKGGLKCPFSLNWIQCVLYHNEIFIKEQNYSGSELDLHDWDNIASVWSSLCGWGEYKDGLFM